MPPHAHARAGSWTTSCRRESACDGACRDVLWRGFLRRVDRPRAPQNLRFSAGEELVEKVTDGGGEEIRRQRVPNGE